MSEAIRPAPLSTNFELEKTSRFTVFRPKKVCQPPVKPAPVEIQVRWDCQYTERIVRSTAARRSWCGVQTLLQTETEEGEPIENVDTTASATAVNRYPIQIGDFEHLDWNPILEQRASGSAYVVRKGLSRKAQLALQLRRFTSKNPNSPLVKAVPETIVLDTWSAHEGKVDTGMGMFDFGVSAGLSNASLRKRIEWALPDAKNTFNAAIEEIGGEEAAKLAPPQWILKPSVTNKGADICLARVWDDVLDILEDRPDAREWVMQRYLKDPLTVGGHKFHLRVYVVAVGALRVFVCENILLLLAAHPYVPENMEDLHCHLTNTARAAEDIDFDERKYVRLLDDLALSLHSEKPERFPTLDSAKKGIEGIRQQIRDCVADLFAAYENEYSIFTPASGCFELYGLDFLVDESLNVHFLEANPGPDFKQTGQRLEAVIVQLWEQVFRVVVDTNILLPMDSPDHPLAKVSESDAQQSPHEAVDVLLKPYWSTAAPDLSLVYSKEWSIASMKGGMSLR